MILKLLLVTCALAVFNANDATRAANAKNKTNVSNRKIYAQIKKAATAGNYDTRLNLQCYHVEFLKGDGYSLYDDGCSPYPDHMCTCIVSWSPVVKEKK